MLKQAILPSASLLLAFSLVACSADEAGTEADGADAQLSIVGDSQLTVTQGVETTLRVRYHDATQAPLAGEISFSVEGADSSFLASPQAATNEIGEAAVTLTVSSNSQPFKVSASAAGAKTVSWNVQLSAIPLVIDGDYDIQSKFSLAAGNSGIDEAVSIFDEMTDDPNDPGTWLIDVLLAELDSGFVSGAVGFARPSLDGWIKSLMLQGTASDYAQKASQIAAELRGLNKNIGTQTELRIRPWTEDGSYRATHELIAMVADIGGNEFVKDLNALGVAEISSQNVHVARTDKGELAIDDHELELPYGAMALATLEEAIIPLVEPQASSVSELLASFVDCQEIGASIADYIGVGSASTYDGPCNAAMQTAAAHVESKLLEMDSGTPALLKLNGFAKFADANADGQVDELKGGNWYGSMALPLQSDRSFVEGESTFTGTLAR